MKTDLEKLIEAVNNGNEDTRNELSSIHSALGTMQWTLDEIASHLLQISCALMDEAND